MSFRLVRIAAALTTLAGLALGASGCDVLKQESFAVSQPKAVGPVRVHFEICTSDFNAYAESGYNDECPARVEDGQAQDFFALALPAGTVPPPTITAVPKSDSLGAKPIVFTQSKAIAEKAAEPFGEQPAEYPPGSELTGYISPVFEEKAGEDFEWNVDVDLKLPSTPSPYAGPYEAGIWFGWRRISNEKPESRPINCAEYEDKGGKTIVYGYCVPFGNKATGVSDLVLTTPPAATAAFVGANKAQVPFTLTLGSTTAQAPGFALTAATSLSAAKTSVSATNFAPAINPNSHLSDPTSRIVNVAVPDDAKPGVYGVTLTATAADGTPTAVTAQLRVTRPAIKLLGLKRRPDGTAILTVSVPAAGKLVVRGQGLSKGKRTVKGAGKFKLRLRAKGGAKNELRSDGKVKLRPTVAFTPVGAAAVTRTRGVTLKLGG